ncbi:DUF6332 family protein [Streptomyces turgidiscabies]|uniref:Uncharacterized protein n=1 Tax=Streptomyces turgidiscabies (strain Car8) TaxID=698760 RepID=L7EVP7_STRT8|nr:MULTISPECIES: DUF6332 family protein [Streptomyces]ELP63493.1 hypothetical protein STRTUCAR8_00755 [Streptomyces turgidiscabies Car8]MDX3496272.1 DUF6332 family protein [Streptomyces turgidiscabies]GAQ74943.1 hypothetical protein T45_06724 [Streptomyces turgidiscabies]
MDNYGDHMGQGRARNSQARRDAVTVEIGYALCSAVFLAAVVFAVVTGPAWVFDLSDTAQRTLVAAGATLGAVLFMVRVVSVLNRFGRAGDTTDGSQPSQPGRTNPDS